MNRKAGLNLLVCATTESIQQWAPDIKGKHIGILIFIHKLFVFDHYSIIVLKLHFVPSIQLFHVGGIKSVLQKAICNML
jgi:hypothetical protein